MNDREWISTASGLRGPDDLVRQAEATLESQVAAADIGLPIVEAADPLVTGLVLAQAAHALRLYLAERRIRGRAREASRPRPGHAILR